MNISQLIGGIVGEVRSNVRSNRTRPTKRKVKKATKKQTSRKISKSYSDYEDDLTTEQKKALRSKKYSDGKYELKQKGSQFAQTFYKKNGKVMSWREKIAQDKNK